ncbi:uncharacterized protein LOC132269691 [Cornus florida]|uniref:uncharacterized protein LOC132269691 n=1 Tax=Cornus florida TaxID=4283 RepID=UPI00289926F8|nr:uncharacterized protein LOC132269691 [Cornus florida]
MSNLTKLEFVTFDISGKNYLSWILDAEIHLNAVNLGHTIKADNEASLHDRAKAMIFLHHYLHEELKTEYLTQQYRERRFTKYSELISCLLVAEQNNEFLLKNHQSRPTGVTPFPETNASSSHGRRRGRGRGRGRGLGRDH